MPRFVVLRHELPADSPRPSHWDLMLERGDVLRTWALPQSPLEPTQIAEALADHRPHYLDYEGPISRGRGVVSRWDDGGYQTLEESAERIVVRFTGQKLRGRLMLERLVDDSQRWRLSWSAERSAVSSAGEGF